MEIAERAFQEGLVIELSGANDTVVKFLPALTIEEDTLREGLAVIDKVIRGILSGKQDRVMLSVVQ